MTFVFVKDKFVEEKDALISVKERGFRFGDGVFETIRVYKGNPYRFENHLQRLADGLKSIKIEFDYIDSVKDNSLELIKKNSIEDGVLRISVSRGIGSKGYLPSNCEPTVIIETSPLPNSPEEPVSLWLSSYKKPSTYSMPINQKLMQGLNSSLARVEAVENDCFEALQVNDAGNICECSSANIFWFNGDTMYTPAAECGLLLGTIREVILEISPYRVKEGKYNLDDLKQAEEVFICNSTWEILGAESLSPLGFSWDKNDKTQELQSLLTKNIEEYVGS